MKHCREPSGNSHSSVTCDRAGVLLVRPGHQTGISIWYMEGTHAHYTCPLMVSSGSYDHRTSSTLQDRFQEFRSPLFSHAHTIHNIHHVGHCYSTSRSTQERREDYCTCRYMKYEMVRAPPFRRCSPWKTYVTPQRSEPSTEVCLPLRGGPNGLGVRVRTLKE